MSTILAIEASAEACSVALSHRGAVSARSINRLKSHSLVILPAVDELLTEAACSPAEIDAISYDCGPGAFTGLRIGLSFAQGLALGWNKPLLPIGSLECLAQATFALQPSLTQVVTLLDARMGEFYAAVFTRTETGFKAIKEPFLCAYQEADGQLGAYADTHSALVGLGAREVATEFSAQFAYVDASMNPDATAMLTLAEAAWQRNQAVVLEAAELVYLRNSVTWDKHQPRRNRDL